MIKINIPDGSIKIQEGLYAYLQEGKTISYYKLYSKEGYCFYIPENNIDFDTQDLLPENKITYYQFMHSAYPTIEQINQHIVSVPVKEGYEIV